jgi:CBS-domain-containing membrane protein
MITVFDKKFKQNKKQFLLQSLFATISIFIILLLLDTVSNAAVIAALGASSFTAFAMPFSKTSEPRQFIGGYLVGIIVGSACYFLSILPFWQDIPFVLRYSNVIFCSIAIGLAVFLMVVTNTEHPPATGMALGLILNKCEVKSIVVVFFGVLCLVFLITILKPHLKNLV